MSQHNTKDSIGKLEPGINGPSAKAGTHNADTMLGELRAALKAQGLDGDTDIFVTADHGFLTISHESRTSASAADGELKSGFFGSRSCRWAWPGQNRQRAGRRCQKSGRRGGAQWRRGPDLSAKTNAKNWPATR